MCLTVNIYLSVLSEMHFLEKEKNRNFFPAERPDFNDAIIMRRGASVEHVVRNTNLLWISMCVFVLK